MAVRVDLLACSGLVETLWFKLEPALHRAASWLALLLLLDPLSLAVPASLDTVFPCLML